MSTTVRYKGDTLAAFANETKTLETSCTWLEDDIEITDESGSGAVIIRDETDSHGGTIRHITTGETVEGTITITTNGTHDVGNYASALVDVDTEPTLQTKSVSYTPTESAQSETVTASSGYDGLSSVSVSVGAISSNYVGSGITRRTSSDLTTSGATVTAPSGYYASSASASVASGTAGTPTATKGTVSNHAVSVTPSVTNTTGYITGGTKTGTAVSVSASELVSGTLSVTSSGTKDVTNYASVSVGAGTEGTPTATKGTVSNNSISVTPSVTNTAGYISGGTKTGTAVTVSASELVSGSETKTENGTYDVTNLEEIVIDVPSSGGTLYTATLTNSGVVNTVNVIHNGTKYYLANDTFDFNEGDVLTINCTRSTYYNEFTVNGRVIISGTSISEYSFILPKYPIEISFTVPTNNISTARVMITAPQINITENGVYDVDDYNYAHVAISGEGYTATEIAERAISGDISGNASQINSYAFCWCKDITTATFPSATSINQFAFSLCTSLTTADFPAVTTIDSSAFAQCSALASISFPAATTIGSCAFQYCRALTTVELPVATTIYHYAFDACYSLSAVNAPMVSSISGYAFRYCSALTALSFSKITRIYGYTFSGCSNASIADFPSVTVIGSHAFDTCRVLTNLNFPKTTYIESYAFVSCYSLPAVSFPSVTTVEAYAFANCYRLITASFPKVTTIYSNAFSKCYNLLSLYLLGSSQCTLRSENAFVSTPISDYTTSTGGVYGSIYVPASLYSSYITSTNWSLYSDRFVSLTDAEIEALG